MFTHCSAGGAGGGQCARDASAGARVPCAVLAGISTMADWSDWPQPPREWINPCDYTSYPYAYPYYQEEQTPPTSQCYQAQTQHYMSPAVPNAPPQVITPPLEPTVTLQLQRYGDVPKGDNPREIRNKAEKQRRDKLNQSISELAAMVPPVVASSRKIDKTGVLRLTAHYLRSHQYVFGDSMGKTVKELSSASAGSLLRLLKGFLITTTYKGIVVVVSQNVQQYLGYTELELLGKNIFTIVHEDDQKLLREQLLPRTQCLGSNGELLVPDEPEGKKKVTEALSNEKRRFIIRFKRLTQRSEQNQYLTCHVEGSLRKSDRACRGFNRCCQMLRRARARADNPCSSGNDVVFIGVVRPMTETFVRESVMESFRLEYRTRHSIDGQIIQCEQRIALVTGYMTTEVKGINAMNFMHRNDVRWVIIALREMYDQHRLVGESCYRLMTKSGQFVYMRTRGRLEVEPGSRAVTSFVCTNTVVDEVEGRHHIRLMKKKFMLMVNNNEESLSEEDKEEEDNEETEDKETIQIEASEKLEKVILHLVTNLPSPQSEVESDSKKSTTLRIIPPEKTKILKAIDRFNSLMKRTNMQDQQQESAKKAPVASERPSSVPRSESSNSAPGPSTNIPLNSPRFMRRLSQDNISLRRRIDGQELLTIGNSNRLSLQPTVLAAPAPRTLVTAPAQRTLIPSSTVPTPPNGRTINAVLVYFTNSGQYVCRQGLNGINHPAHATQENRQDLLQFNQQTMMVSETFENNSIFNDHDLLIPDLEDNIDENGEFPELLHQMSDVEVQQILDGIAEEPENVDNN